MIHKSLEQKVMMYGSESWMVMGAILKILEGFNDREFRRIAGMMEKRVSDGTWEYPPVVAAL